MRTHVIMDFDGVLVDTVPSMLRAYTALRTQRFPGLPHVGNESDLGRLLEGRLKESLYAWLSPADSTRFWRAHAVCMETQPAPVRAPLAAWLRRMPAGSVSIVSGATRGRLRAWSDAEFGGVPPALREVVGTETPGSKATKIGAVAMRVLGTRRGAVYVGDMQNDILAARDAGVSEVAVGYGVHRRAQLLALRPATYVDTADELIDHLSARSGLC